jgi:TPR repeat protein
MYEHGEGTEMNIMVAMEWFTKAAYQGIPVFHNCKRPRV